MNEKKQEDNKDKGGAREQKMMKVKTETREQNYYSFMMSLYLTT